MISRSRGRCLRHLILLSRRAKLSEKIDRFVRQGLPGGHVIRSGIVRGGDLIPVAVELLVQLRNVLRSPRHVLLGVVRIDPQGLRRRRHQLPDTDRPLGTHRFLSAILRIEDASNRPVRNSILPSCPMRVSIDILGPRWLEGSGTGSCGRARRPRCGGPLEGSSRGIHDGGHPHHDERCPRRHQNLEACRYTSPPETVIGDRSVQYHRNVDPGVRSPCFIDALLFLVVQSQLGEVGPIPTVRRRARFPAAGVVPPCEGGTPHPMGGTVLH